MCCKKKFPQANNEEQNEGDALKMYKNVIIVFSPNNLKKQSNLRTDSYTRIATFIIFQQLQQ